MIIELSPSAFIAACLSIGMSLPALAADVTSQPLQAPSKGDGKTLFTTLSPAQTGLDMLNKMDIDHPMSYLYHSGMTTGGVAVADFDNDGQPDIFFAGTTGKNRLYRQTAAFKFEDITAKAGPIDGGEIWSAGATAADVNNDGWVDLYVTNYMEPNQLFLNMGRGKNGEPVVFKELAKAAGMDVVDCSHSAAFADYDGDGDLDMYLLTNRIEDPNGTPRELPIDKTDGVKLKPGAERYYDIWRYDFDNWGTEPVGSDDRLFRNDGNNADGSPKFTDVTDAAGIKGRGDGLSVTWWDYNSDGKPDIYVGNDFIRGDCLYRNNGDGTFTNVINQVLPHSPWFSMGADICDLNNDLLQDLLVADMSATSHYKSKTTMGVMGGMDLIRSYHDTTPQYMRNCLYVNTGRNRFTEAAYLFKLSSTDWTWSVKFADFDLDGWQDVYFTNGISRHMNDSDIKVSREQLYGKHMFEFFKHGEMRKEKHRSYRNTGRDKFEETSDEWGLGHVGVAYGAAYADFDRDGDLDMVVVQLEEPNVIYRNDAQGGNRLLIRLQGKKSNQQGHGATVICETKLGRQLRYLSPQTGYHSGNEPLVHFGLGEADTVLKLTIRWPGAGEQVLTNIAANRFYTITQPSDGGSPVQHEPEPPAMFAAEPNLSIKHVDDGWEADFKVKNQSLLPHALSQLGPGMAWADIDGDGDEDFLLGGSAGKIKWVGTDPELEDESGLKIKSPNWVEAEMAQLRMNNKGNFTAKWSDSLRDAKGGDDMGMVFFDADQDGDLDLYVARGTNEFIGSLATQVELPVQKMEDLAKFNQDRLFLNDGKGNFSDATASLPTDQDHNSAVVAADYDRDGDVDLFVGSRVKIHHYPLSVPSRLLKNETKGGKVKFVSEAMDLGLVTGALWSDANNDGWLDLLVTAEWGPVRILLNEKGKLTDKTEAAGIAKFLGWWNSIQGADIDHDGDIDYVVGNVGLNTKYKQPSMEKPHLTYYGDFFGNGYEIVEVKREGDLCLPERGRSCSSRAMPKIAEMFETFHKFAAATLEDVYGEEKLAAAKKFEATVFETGVLRNEGAAKFTFEPLERLAQISPAFGILLNDFNGDGSVDVFLAQNSAAPQIENPRYMGGLSQLFLNDGKGQFRSVAHRLSGILVPGDAKSAAVCDANNDGRPDIFVATNNGPLTGWLNQQNARWLKVTPTGKSTAGARISLKRDGQPTQTTEIYVGGGYLSQNAPSAWFGIADSTAPGTVTIKWADGTESSEPFDGKTLALTIKANGAKKVANN